MPSPTQPNDPLASYRQKLANTALLNALGRRSDLGATTPAEVRQALDDGADPNVRATTVDHGKGARPLHLAAKHGASRAVIELLVDRGALVGVAMPNGDTALHLAAKHGHVEALDTLLDLGAEITACSSSGHTPLTAALLVKSPRMPSDASNVLPTVERLLARGASLEELTNGCDPHPLHEAVRQLNLGVVVFLLDRGLSPNHRRKQDQLAFGPTPLAALRHSIVGERFNGDVAERVAVAIVDRLVQAGADVNARLSSVGVDNVLSWILQATQVPRLVVQRLLEAGASPYGYVQDRSTLTTKTPASASWALGSLAARGDVATLTLLLDHGLDPNVQEMDGGKMAPLLHHTVLSSATTGLDRLQAVQCLLVERGANLNLLNQDGFAPLHQALLLADQAAAMAHVGMLLRLGADPNVATSHGVAPLTLAGQPDEVSDRWFNRNERGLLIDLLLAHGADPFQAMLGNVPLPFAELVSPVFRERVQAHIEAHPPTQERFVEALQQAWIREVPHRVGIMLDLWLSDASKLGVDPGLILNTYRAQEAQIFGERRRVLDTMVPVLEARILQQAANAVPMTAIERQRSRL